MRRFLKWFDQKYVFGYYQKHGTYKGLPRYREILNNRFYKGYKWRDSIKHRWVIR